MRSFRIVAVLFLSGLIPSLAACSACGDSSEQVELREYSAWVDRQHGAQEESLRPLRSLETGKGAISSFLSEIGTNRDNGDLAAIQQRAKAALADLRRVRDELRPTYAKLRREVDAKQPTAARIGDLHGQLVRAVELRDRALVTLARVADLAEELIALENAPTDPEIEKALVALDAKIKGEIGAVAMVFQQSDAPIGEDMGRLLEALKAAGLDESETAQKAQILVGGQFSLFQEFARHLGQIRQIGHLVPLLTAVEAKVIPDFVRVVEEGKALEFPAGAARTAWAKVIGHIEERTAALRRLPKLKADLEKAAALMQNSPAQRATELVDDIIRRIPTISDDLEQAASRYERFASELRSLRAAIL